MQLQYPPEHRPPFKHIIPAQGSVQEPDIGDGSGPLQLQVQTTFPLIMDCSIEPPEPQ